MWVVGLAMLDDQSASPSELPIFDVAKKYQGAIGNIELNDAGDLSSANYDLWTVGHNKWYKIGNYNHVTDDILWKGN